MKHKYTHEQYFKYICRQYLNIFTKLNAEFEITFESIYNLIGKNKKKNG